MADQMNGRRKLSRSKKMSAFAAMLLQRLRHDADVGYACLLDGIHDGGKSAEGNIFIGAQKNRLPLGITQLLAYLRANLVDIDGIVSEENMLLTVNADDQPLFRNFLHRAR